MLNLLWILSVFLIFKIYFVYGHGRLWEPIARSSAWRIDSSFPINYNDMQMFCGGFDVQWNQNSGKCGICGDSYSDQIKPWEKGGSGYTGKSVKTYIKGQAINVRVELTANHYGWFEFRLCKVDGLIADATQECLDKTLLKDVNGKTRFNVTDGINFYNYSIVLPSNLSCEHCVFQWKYHTGNRWGIINPVTGEGCLGCGTAQEEFYGCSDITISNSSGSTASTIKTPITTTKSVTSTTKVTTKTTTTTATTTTIKKFVDQCSNGDGFYPDYNSNCKKFFICITSTNSFSNSVTLLTVSCPPGTLFDINYKICNFENQVKCNPI